MLQGAAAIEARGSRHAITLLASKRLIMRAKKETSSTHEHVGYGTRERLIHSALPIGLQGLFRRAKHATAVVCMLARGVEVRVVSYPRWQVHRRPCYRNQRPCAQLLIIPQVPVEDVVENDSEAAGPLSYHPCPPPQGMHFVSRSRRPYWHTGGADQKVCMQTQTATCTQSCLQP